ncbi:E3 ubiquitin-protein ligase SHPRH [Quillaja saponaria]|uniref:E3 ubiquitin-protein ligase SHPRH n=1 Tax=Quillaja saponaria TaxID=32244 RepID=A0AAD7LW15_QUISA|nr:E3 ubiquitin-protein ligase SHPRH [Quillaja saponaria]
MGRRKQSRPHRSGGVALERNDNPGELGKQKEVEVEQGEKNKTSEIEKPFFVEVDQSCLSSNEHLDISEVVLTDLKLTEGFSGFELGEDFYQGSKYSFRFQVCDVSKFLGRIKLGHWPVLSYSNISLELVEKGTENHVETCTVVLSGSFDGPDDGITGLVHLASLKFLTLRPVLGFRLSEDLPSLRVRVEILESAFHACESLLDSSRQPWKRSMINTISWLRPEVMTSEARYGVCKSVKMEVDSQTEVEDDTCYTRKHAKFDAAGFYEAIKPSKADPMLEDDIPDLRAKLRPYQCRAAYWMVRREKNVSGSLDGRERSELYSPLCVPVDFLDTCSKMFFNPFSGNVTLNPEPSPPYVFGGILADEMGLGKTVELLACIFVHRKPESEGGILLDSALQNNGDQQNYLKRLRRERVECTCGAVSESIRYKGLWVQCDICDAWQHADCVGYSPKGKSLKSKQGFESRKYKTTIAMRDGEYVCQMCSELIQATESPIASGATLIVCPAPILPQWHTEIIRHTRPGSLKTYIYEGVRETSFSDTSLMDISELVSADIVLTTYDVLKEDLSHDSDRHQGDRRFMRFQKRYPVIPTLLTRIFWWRVCLDEAQMVESNASAATEMAGRLYAKHRWCITGTPIQRKLDDLYGLLRFLKASPFNVCRWWTEVIRDPYEGGDTGAMEFTQKFFKQLMWRSLKVHVADELLLPPQEECLSWLALSPIEEHFYKRQHETCVHYAHEVIESLKNGSVSSDASSDPFITHAEAGKLLNTLLKLRQACCHPQVGSSGLRSLQQSPMTMEEILMVLIDKTKIEGEEALRRSVVALNGLAAIAIIERELSRAVFLYREALSLAEEHSKDFRLDPLLNIHIHQNLAEILPQTTNSSHQLPSKGKQFTESSHINNSKIHSIIKHDQCVVKRQKLSGSNDLDFTITSGNPVDGTFNLSKNDLNGDQECDHELPISATSFCVQCLRTACGSLKQKYLSSFSSKLSVAQQEFRKSYMQVSNAFNDRENQHTAWWLEALQHAEQNKDFSSELIRKIEESLSVISSKSKSSRIAARFRSISGLKYHIQTGLDQVEASRKVLLDRLLETDHTLEKPKEEDIERVGNCQNCQPNRDGPPCVLCELDELFQNYEVRLFHLKKECGGIFTSAEEAVDLQRKNTALNRFLQNLSQPNKNMTSSTVGYEESKKRDAKEKVVVTRDPSQLEAILGIIRNYCKAHLGRDSVSAATKQLQILEVMRKEFVHARALAVAQAQFLRAHDEIKMAISRLRLMLNEDDKSPDAFSKEELPSLSLEYNDDKLMSLALLSRIKGKLRYLEGLVQSKQKPPLESMGSFSVNQETTTVSNFMEERSGHICKADEETCPVCQERLSNQKMVFQCGHVTCCKCLFSMTEQRIHTNKSQDNWVMCPTCRQHTDFGNIAYAVDRHNKCSNSTMLNTIEGCEKFEASITVKGSYGTKIEAITRRILWIKSADAKAKVLVFSSWNDVLDVLEHALAANGITFIRMKGGRKSQFAISEFRGQKISRKGSNMIESQQSEPQFIQVLLLLIQHGANGLNLLEAQHVVLVEPLLNPAAEAQAISRVHRIGQEKRTLVHRFIVKNTVEESIYKLNRSRSNNSFIPGNKKNVDQPVLTIKDVESLFATAPSTVPETDEKPTESLRNLPPSVAAAIAAERRLNEQRT